MAAGPSGSRIIPTAAHGGHDLEFLGDFLEGCALRKAVERIADGLKVSHGIEAMSPAGICKFCGGILWQQTQPAALLCKFQPAEPFGRVKRAGKRRAEGEAGFGGGVVAEKVDAPAGAGLRRGDAE